MTLPLDRVVDDIASALAQIDRSAAPFRTFQPGVGPYGEPQLLSLVAVQLDTTESYRGKVRTKRTPDLLISGEWALEVKIVRPFGDNGKPAENWSVNLLHPYEGNTSLLGDCLKLARLQCIETKAVVVIGFEHTPPKISLSPLLTSFEVIATNVLSIRLGGRHSSARTGLIHPVHQQLIVCGWQVDTNP